MEWAVSIATAFGLIVGLVLGASVAFWWRRFDCTCGDSLHEMGRMRIFDPEQRRGA